MKTNFSFQPFAAYVRFNSLPGTRNRAGGTEIRELKLSEKGVITATVLDKDVHRVEIRTTHAKISSVDCSCGYHGFGACEHILRTIEEADDKVFRFYQAAKTLTEVAAERQADRSWLLREVRWSDLDIDMIKELTHTVHYHNEMRWSSDWEDLDIEQNRLAGVFNFLGSPFTVVLSQDSEGIHLDCSCANKSDYLCQHLSLILRNHRDQVYKAAFDPEYRSQLINRGANRYGFNQRDQDPESIFQIRYFRGQCVVEPRINLINFSRRELEQSVGFILSRPALPWEAPSQAKKEILILASERFVMHPRLMLATAVTTKTGELRSHIKPVDINAAMANAESPEEFKFLRSLLTISFRQAHIPREVPYADFFKALRIIFKRVKDFDSFVFDDDGGKITPAKLKPVKLEMIHPEIIIRVEEKHDFMVVSCHLQIRGEFREANTLKLPEPALLVEKDTITFLNSQVGSKVLAYFREQGDVVYIQKSQFQKFKETFLDPLEDKLPVHYKIVREQKKLVPSPRKANTDKVEKRVLLSESENYILIQPTVVYGDIELPLYSSRALYEERPDGTRVERERNEWLEHGFRKLMQSLHTTFEESDDHDFHYLTRQEFLDEGWFLDAFETLRREDVHIFGFNQLSRNRFNSNKSKIVVDVRSGIDWFAVEPKITFGDQKVELAELQKAVMKQSRYVQLGDGSEGILPEEWLQKFSSFFRSAEISDGAFKTSKAQFTIIDELYKTADLDVEKPAFLNHLNERFSAFEDIAEVHVPKLLQADLRDYQKAGLNWLCFLDDFGFGGCLADDMGLGKTIQMIAFVLRQHEKGIKQTNLVVAPTSIIFNWEQELKRFAPHLRVAKHVGGSRIPPGELMKYDVVLTTYGIMMLDIEAIRGYDFNLVILDESQAIKNPASKRYKAARLLKGRRKFVMTGTPIENNTFDLFSQLSFAMPGLLGNSKFFKDVYSTPIDKFQDSERAQELRKKVHPFVLRRTKKQVARELPEKTEMTVFCELTPRQRQLYVAYKKKIEDILKDPEASSGQKSGALLSGLTKLRQICNSPVTLGDEEDYGEDSAKLEELMSQIEEKKAEHKMIVFSQFVTMLDLVSNKLSEAGIPFCMLTGNSSNRQEEVERFQNDESVRVFLVSLKAGGVGLNLTRADYVFLLDPWWNPAAENQAIDRAYRIGQEKHVVAVRFISPDTIEEKVMELQDRKREVATDIIRTDEEMLKSLSQEQLLSML